MNAKPVLNVTIEIPHDAVCITSVHPKFLSAYKLSHYIQTLSDSLPSYKRYESDSASWRLVTLYSSLLLSSFQ